MLNLEIFYLELEQGLVQFCYVLFFSPLTLKCFYIDGGKYSRKSDGQWPELLQPFTLVEDLYLSEDFA